MSLKKNVKELNMKQVLQNPSVNPLLSLDEKQFFTYLAAKIADRLQADMKHVYLIKGDHQSEMIVGADDQMAKALAPVIQYAQKMRRYYVSHSLASDPLYAQVSLKAQTALAVPVIVDGDVFAVIHLASHQPNFNYSESEVTIVNEIINEHIVSLQNLKLYLAARKLNEELLAKIDHNAGIQNLNQGDAIDRQVNEIKFLGRDENLLIAINQAKKIAQDDFPLLIEGEGGVGKRSLAQKIHFWGNRKNEVVSIVECGTAQSRLIKRELLGDHDLVGALTRSQGGTVILNDLHLTPKDIQALLLDILITGYYFDENSSEKRKANVRFIGLSKKSLVNDLKEGRFRDDLYYRLTLGHIRLPKLSERGDDIAILADYYLNNGRGEKLHLTQNSIEMLKSHSWPGNINELMNTMERTRAMASGQYINEVEIANFEQQRSKVQESSKREVFVPRTLFEVEKEFIFKTLDYLEGNKTKTAKTLGITVKTLYNKLHSYGAFQEKQA